MNEDGLPLALSGTSVFRQLLSSIPMADSGDERDLASDFENLKMKQFKTEEAGFHFAAGS